jgi:DNA topoisomerase I
MNGHDPTALAEGAGLVYADESMAWRRRIGRGRSFAYREPDGSPAPERVKDWIVSLAIPPAWKRVQIAGREDSHILATGHDREGRKQYLYHPLWEEMRDGVKFDRMWAFGGRISRLRKRVDSDLRLPGLPQARIVALAVAVLDRSLIRVGNRRSATNVEAYGLTTLTTDHVEVRGAHVHFEFIGKGGAESHVLFEDRQLAALISRCEELSGQTLFSYSADGTTTSVGSDDVNTYLANAMGGRFTAKDFRTWGATTTVAGELAVANGSSNAKEAVFGAIDAAAERLGNTREVCRSSYVHPTVIEAFHDERLAGAWKRSKNGQWLQRSESAVLKLSPERT